MLTLGLYSAWSKIRLQQYLLAHTRIDNSAFDYRANPLVILRGRIIAFVLLAFYYFIDYFSLTVFFTILALIQIPLPFFIISALRFKSRNTYHRNLRFNFSASYWQVFYVFSLLYLLATVSLGLLYPLYEYKKRKLLMNQYYYADQKFKFTGRLKYFYTVFLRAVFFFLILATPFIITVINEIDFRASLSDNAGSLLFAHILDIMIRIMLLTLPLYFTYTYLSIHYLNYTLNHTTVGPVKLKADLKFWPLFKIITINSILIPLTLGLYFPVAKIRKLQYIYSCLSIITNEQLITQEFNNPDDSSGLGDALNDASSLDIGL